MSNGQGKSGFMCRRICVFFFFESLKTNTLIICHVSIFFKCHAHVKKCRDLRGGGYLPITVNISPHAENLELLSFVLLHLLTK